MTHCSKSTYPNKGQHR